MPRRRPRRPGRPTLLSADVETAILDALAEGSPITHAAAAAGIHPARYFDWIRRGEDAAADARETGEPVPEADQPYAEFAERVSRARAQGAVTAVELIRRCARGGAVVREITRRYRDADTGELVTENEVVRAAPDWRAAAWWLERAHRGEFGRSAEPDGFGGYGPAGPPPGAGVSANAFDELASRVRANLARVAEIGSGPSMVVEGEVVDRA